MVPFSMFALHRKSGRIYFFVYSVCAELHALLVHCRLLKLFFFFKYKYDLVQTCMVAWSLKIVQSLSVTSLCTPKDITLMLICPHQLLCIFNHDNIITWHPSYFNSCTGAVVAQVVKALEW